MADSSQVDARSLRRLSFPGSHAADPEGTMFRLWRDVRPLRTAESLEAEMGSLTPRLYEQKTFEAPYPALDEVREALSREADEKVRPLAFWRAWQLRDEYVKGHVRERYAKLVASWEREREAFDAREARIAEERDAAAVKNCERRRGHIRKVLEGDAGAIGEGAERLSSECAIPLPFTLRYAYEEGAGRMAAEVDLPSPGGLPQTTVEVMKSGRSRPRPKTQRAVREEYARYVFALIAYLAHGLFDLSPAIGHVVISGYRTGEGDGGECVLSVLFDREGFVAALDDVTDPEAFCLSFEHRCQTTKTKVIKPVEPLERL